MSLLVFRYTQKANKKGHASGGPWRAPRKPSGSTPGQQAAERCLVQYKSLNWIEDSSFYCNPWWHCHLVLHDFTTLFCSQFQITSSFSSTDYAWPTAKQPGIRTYTGSVSVFALDLPKSLTKHVTGQRTQKEKPCPSSSPLSASTATSDSCWRTAGLSWTTPTWFWCRLTTPLSLHGVSYFTTFPYSQDRI